MDCVWYNKEKGPGQSTCEALTELSEQLRIDVLVVGSFGRKGEKLDMLGEHPWLGRRCCIACRMLSHHCFSCALQRLLNKLPAALQGLAKANASDELSAHADPVAGRRTAKGCRCGCCISSTTASPLLQQML